MLPSIIAPKPFGRRGYVLRLLFVTKRRPQQRDLLDRPYGRFHCLPAELARRGHHVRVLLCSHQGLPPERRVSEGVEWIAHDLRALGPRGLLHALEAEAGAFAPDWVVGCSDAWYGPLARRLARRTNARLAVDAYDDYEAYMPWNMPLHWAWRGSLRAAGVVTAAGPQLARMLDRQRPGQAPAIVVPMAADPMFVAHDRIASRSTLGLPEDAPLVGYAGGWAHKRGTDVLVDAFRRARARKADLGLVLTGRPPAHVLAEPGVIALGYVDDAQLPFVLSSLDAACVITADTAFGRSSYPAKLCEAMACQVPVVATDTQPVRWMLRGDERFLVPVGDPRAIAERMLDGLEMPRIAYPDLPTWATSAEQFEAALTGG